MGAFLVGFDRVIRRERRTRTRSRYDSFPTQAAADVAFREWEAQGYRQVSSWSSGGRITLYFTKTEEVVVVPGNTRMPRPLEGDLKKNMTLSDAARQKLEKKFRLFSMPTRRYLRRRAWRYFRTIGKTDPQRYIRAAAVFLTRYTDADTDSDIHLLDNWGLIHALFRHSPALVCPAHGWDFALASRSPISPPHHGSSPPGPKTRQRCSMSWWERSAALRASGRCGCSASITSRGCRLALWQPSFNWPITRTPNSSAFGFDLLEKATDLESVPVDEWLKPPRWR